MLIEAPYKIGDTVSFKTIAGEEVIARLDDENDKELTISKPMALTATQEGLGLVPFTFTVSPDAKLKINRNTIVFLAKTQEDMAKQYIERTTGIKI